MGGGELFLADRYALRAGWRYDAGTKINAPRSASATSTRSGASRSGCAATSSSDHARRSASLSLRYFYDALGTTPPARRAFESEPMSSRRWSSGVGVVRRPRLERRSIQRREIVARDGRGLLRWQASSKALSAELRRCRPRSRPRRRRPSGRPDALAQAARTASHAVCGRRVEDDADALEPLGARRAR